jgi:hypothetical protein
MRGVNERHIQVAAAKKPENISAMVTQLAR